MLKKLLIPASAVVAAVLLTSSAAFAQACFVVHRSDQGATSVGHSGRWVSIRLAEIMADDPANGGVGFCPAQHDAAVPAPRGARPPPPPGPPRRQGRPAGAGARPHRPPPPGQGTD